MVKKIEKIKCPRLNMKDFLSSNPKSNSEVLVLFGGTKSLAVMCGCYNSKTNSCYQSSSGNSSCIFQDWKYFPNKKQTGRESLEYVGD